MIRMNDFQKEPMDLQHAEVQAVSRVIRSGWYILGPEVKAFEANWARTCAVVNAVGVGNGMDAIEIGLRALGIGRGDEVITTPMTAFATVLAVLRAGAIPVLADIDLATGLLSMESVGRCMSSRTKAILLVHLYGQVRGMEKWQEFAKAHKIYLLEDCAQAHLAESQGKIAGTFGEWGAYSFYPTKNLGSFGDAGTLVTNNSEIAAKSRVLRNYGQSDRYHHLELGLNSRLDEIHAALLLERLKYLHHFTRRRQEIAAHYSSGIKNSFVSLLASPETEKSHTYHLYVICSREREKLSKFLQSKGIETLIHYPVPVHQQKPCAEIKRDPRGLVNSEKFSQECLSLPCHPQLENEDIETVIEEINAFH